MAFMNGIGPEDAVGEYISKERICRGVVNYAGNLHDDGVVANELVPPAQPDRSGHRARDHAGRRQLEEILTDAGLTTVQVSHHDMKKAAFFKTILNSALNALCAAHGLTMAQAMRLKHTRRTARILLREGLTVAGLVGYNYGEDTCDRCMDYLDAGGDHYPSMWFDLREQRPTEIEYINGKIVKIGRMFNGRGRAAQRVLHQRDHHPGDQEREPRRGRYPGLPREQLSGAAARAGGARSCPYAWAEGEQDDRSDAERAGRAPGDRCAAGQRAGHGGDERADRAGAPLRRGREPGRGDDRGARASASPPAPRWPSTARRTTRPMVDGLLDACAALADLPDAGGRAGPRRLPGRRHGADLLLRLRRRRPVGQAGPARDQARLLPARWRSTSCRA